MPAIFSLAAPVEVGTQEEAVQCSRLIFKEDFLSDQYFGENQPASIVTEKVHFGEGMHRRAFRTKLHTGQIPLLLPGHSCVLKVHNSISYGTKNSDELIKKNFTLAVEVTARISYCVVLGNGYNITWNTFFMMEFYRITIKLMTTQLQCCRPNS